MPRSIWNGALSFGLVNVPVQLFSATQQKDVRFHQFQAGTGQRIRDRRVAEESGEEVAYEDIVKGYEIDPIHFEKTYYLAPRPETGAERAYALLRTAMERANKVSVGRFVMRTKQSLGAIRPWAACCSDKGVVSGCVDCRDGLEHCHGAFVLHDDGSVECTAGPACRLDSDAHWFVISADDRRDAGVLPPERGGTPPVTG